MTPDMIGVGEDCKRSHPPGDLYRGNHVQPGRYQVGDAKYEEVPLLGRDLDSRYDENGCREFERFLCAINRVMVGDGDRIEPYFLSTFQNLFDTAFAVF